MSQIGEFEAQVRGELLARRAGSLGWCAACGEPILLEGDSMWLEGRLAHVDCRPGTVRRDLYGLPASTPGRFVAPRVARARIALTCTLRRRIGSPIAAETIELGPDGMRVTAERPLATDETVNFDLPNLQMRVAGLARVLRQQRSHVYALRFEHLPDPMYRCLHALAIRAARAELD